VSFHVCVSLRCARRLPVGACGTSAKNMDPQSLEEKLALAPKYGQNQAWLLLNSLLADEEASTGAMLYSLDGWLHLIGPVPEFITAGLVLQGLLARNRNLSQQTPSASNTAL
jgi:hypothetical protein